MEDLLFELPSDGPKSIVMDATQVRERLARVLEDDDLRRYIL
jgi:ATP-dependent protease HslVU (ClpYQ) ATPase subunit